MIPNRNVVIIPSMKRSGNNGNKDEIPKLRVAAYCRVSTDSEEQSSSYDVQIEHYTEFIKKKMKDIFPSIMLKIAMNRLFPKNYTCKFRRKFIEEAISTREQSRTNEFIVASTL